MVLIVAMFSLDQPANMHLVNDKFRFIFYLFICKKKIVKNARKLNSFPKHIFQEKTKSEEKKITHNM